MSSRRRGVWSFPGQSEVLGHARLRTSISRDRYLGDLHQPALMYGRLGQSFLVIFRARNDDQCARVVSDQCHSSCARTASQSHTTKTTLR